ncbi:MAG: hypothetical protein LAT83_00405 [Kiritimatiellae bacterium]|nr:hypothetical protein [Kiritimatiellia bacterium]
MKMKMILVLAFLLPLYGAEILYPSGSDLVVDVTAHTLSDEDGLIPNLDPDGLIDATPALQRMVTLLKADTRDDLQESPAILYFPNGTYRLTDRIIGSVRKEGLGWILLQGQSRDGVVLRLDDHAAPFQDPDQPLPLIDWFAEDLIEGNENRWTNNAFLNGIENLTVNVGTGNPGATALKFFCNNLGFVRNVRLLAPDDAAIGLDLRGRTNGIGSIRDLTVEGFRVGIDLSHQTSMMPFVFENITLSGQSLAGIRVFMNPLSIRNLVSQNTVPALVSLHEGTLITLTDSQLSGGLPEDAALDLQKGSALLRNVEFTGYGHLLLDADGFKSPDTFSDDFHSLSRLSKWPDAPARGLRLEVPPIPEVPLDAPDDWLIVDPEGYHDHTQLLQAALNSGATTLVLKPGHFRVSNTLVIGPSIRRIEGQFARITVTADNNRKRDLRMGEPDPLPLFVLEDSDHPAVLIRRIHGNWGALLPDGNHTHTRMIELRAGIDLILQDVWWTQGPLFQNDPVAGARLFIENVLVLPGTSQGTPNRPHAAIELHGISAWMRQINTEMQMPHLVNQGGNLWVFGFKTGEITGPIIEASHHARTELLNGALNTTDNVIPAAYDHQPILRNRDSWLSATFVERATYGDGGGGWLNNRPESNHAHEVVVEDTRGTETRELHFDERPTRPWNGLFWQERGAFINLYTSSPDLTHPAPSGEIQADLYHPFGTPLDLSATLLPEGTRVFWRKISGPGRILIEDPTSSVTTATFSAPGEYRLQLTLSNGLQETMREHHLVVGLTGPLDLRPVDDMQWNRNLNTGTTSLRSGFHFADNQRVTRVQIDGDNVQSVWGLIFDPAPLRGLYGHIAATEIRMRVSHVQGSGNVVELVQIPLPGMLLRGPDYDSAGTSAAPETYDTHSVGDFRVFSLTDPPQNPTLYRLQHPTASTPLWSAVGFHSLSAQDAENQPVLRVFPAPPALPDSPQLDHEGLDWTISENPLQLQRQKETGDWVNLALVPGGSDHWTLPDLGIGPLRLRARHVNAAGASEWSYLPLLDPQTAPQPGLDPHLILRLTFNDGTLKDSSPSDLAITGTVTFTEEEGRGYAVLNGIDQRINVPLQRNFPNGLTISFWTRALDGENGMPKNTGLGWAHQEGADGLVLAPGWNNAPRRIFRMGRSDGVNDEAATPEVTDFLNTWVHWAFVKNPAAGTLRVYRDGRLWHTATGKTIVPAFESHWSTGPGLRIGEVWGTFYKGHLDDYRIYDTALSQEAVHRVFLTRPATPSTAFADWQQVFYGGNDDPEAAPEAIPSGTTLTNFQLFAYGGHPQEPPPRPVLETPGAYPELIYHRRMDGHAWPQIRHGTDLIAADWSEPNLPPLSVTPVGDGIREKVRIRAPKTLDEESLQFFAVEVHHLKP